MKRRSSGPVRTLPFLSVLLAGGLVLGFLALGPAGPAPAPDSVPAASDAPEPPPAFEQSERERIRTHLARIEAEMRAEDVSHLGAAQRENRARLLDVLAEYRERGIFPRNPDFPGELVPYFVDDRGVHCAVGYLLHRSGRDEVVEHVAGSRNHATVPELADEPALMAWLDEAGITLDEAARIQPAYCGHGWGDAGWGCPGPGPDSEEKSLGGPYLAATAGALVLEGTALSLNLASLLREEPSGWRGALALATGVGGVGLGVHGMREPGDRRSAGFLHLAVGLFTTATGVHALRSLGARDEGGTGRPFADDEELLHQRTDTGISKAGAGNGSGLEVRPLIRGATSDRQIGLAFRLRH